MNYFVASYLSDGEYEAARKRLDALDKLIRKAVQAGDFELEAALFAESQALGSLLAATSGVLAA